MAGKFAYIQEECGVIEATTHGCGCCAETYYPSKEELEEHIKYLEKDIEETKKFIEKYFTE